MRLFKIAFNKIRNYYSPTARELRRIIAYPRATNGYTLLEDGIEFTDSLSFYGGYEDIFMKKKYAFRALNRNPYIIDCGSNIGLSIIFFKQYYPDAEICGFEPDPTIFKVLQRNISKRKIKKIDLHNSAVGSEVGNINFIPDAGFSGRVSEKPTENTISVPVEKLSKYITKEVDLLKLDIEGHEVEVLQEIREKLKLVKNIFIEYHSILKREQNLDALLKILKENSFRVHLKDAPTAEQPLVVRPLVGDMDNLIEVYAWKTH